MRILVTGGAGFIGSHYVRTLLSGGYPGYEGAGVTVLDKLTYAGNLANLDPVAGNPRLRFVQGDICDAALLAALLPGHDAVLNFAAETHVDRSIDGASDFVAANVVGVQVLLQACLDAGVSRVVQVSTDEVYGSIAEGSWTEDAPLAPNSPYSAAKAGGDLMARAYARTHGLDVSITRCCNNYGPYQFPEKIIPLFVTNLLDGLKVPLYGDGGNVRDWIHVDDHCRGIQLVLEQGTAAAVYHINGDVELTNLELTRAILEHCGAGWDMVTPVQDRKGHDRRYSLDDGALRALGYAPRIPFADGLTETVRWYADHRSWWEPLKRAQGEPLRFAAAAEAGPRARNGHPGRARPVSRWLVTGAGGMLGRDLVAVLEHRGEAVTGLSRSDLDITDTGAVQDALARWQPAVVVNCAAWTAVDDAETSEDAALRVNGDAVAGLAACCASRGIALVQISTDYVFDGLGREPYPEDGAPGPAHRVWPDQAGRGTGRAGAGKPGRVRGPYRLALRDPRAELRRHNDQEGTGTGAGPRGGRPARAAHLVSGCGGPDPCPDRLGGGAGDLPCDQQRRDHLVRARAGGLPAAGRGPGPGPARHEQHPGASRAAARLQRARPCGLGPGRAHAHRRLGAGAAAWTAQARGGHRRG